MTRLSTKSISLCWCFFSLHIWYVEVIASLIRSRSFSIKIFISYSRIFRSWNLLHKAILRLLCFFSIAKESCIKLQWLQFHPDHRQVMTWSHIIHPLHFYFFDGPSEFAIDTDVIAMVIPNVVQWDPFRFICVFVGGNDTAHDRVTKTSQLINSISYKENTRVYFTFLML